jgi:Flp pilus assembly protein TadD
LKKNRAFPVITRVSQIKAGQLKLIDVSAPLARLLLLVPVALALTGSWYAGRWYTGDVVAEYAPNLETGAIETAKIATRLAPDDPLTHWTVAALEKLNLPPDRVQETLGEYEKAVSLSPNDYRLWADLGRTRGQAGDTLGGEKALRRAVELAPTYAEPRWLLGNLLLRAGRTDDAFAELRLAGEADPRMRPQIFNMAGHIFGLDIQAMSHAVGSSAAARADLATYLVNQGRIDDALGQWATLSAAEKIELGAAGKALMATLLGAKRIRAAFKIYLDVNPQGATGLHEEQLLNGGFESDLGLSPENPFDWRVQSAAAAQVEIDDRYRHGGNRSLRIRYKAPGPISANHILQLVVVEPSTSYRLEYYVRSADLNSAATPYIMVQDGADGVVLGSSAPLPAGTNDWRLVVIDFKTPPKTEAINIGTNREICEAGDTGEVCPIFGTVWYDDFNLQRGGSGADPKGRSAERTGASSQGAR